MSTITIHLSDEQWQTILQNRKISIEISIDEATASDTKGCVNSRDSFFALFLEQIQRLRSNGNQRTYETYSTAYRKFKTFLKDRDIAPVEITAELMEAYQTYLRSSNLSMNTISFHMRILRAVYHKAVEREMTDDRKPFHKVYTGMAKTDKRAIGLEDIQRIKRIPLESPKLRFARDMFLFSFYTRGMSLVDMAFLKKSDIRNEVLTYKRHKTGQQLQIRWEKEMQEIVDRYPSKTGIYLLPIIHSVNGNERNQYRNYQTQINSNLKEIAKLTGIEQKLTMYCARHSWATIARELKVPIEVISRGMGHNNERTTEIYLKSIALSTIDSANRKIQEQL